MEEKVWKFIQDNHLIKEKDKIVVGVSGGPDSMALLNVLLHFQQEKKLSFELVVCHVNHMMREEAGSDEDYVASFCKQHNVAFYSKKIPVKKIAEKEKIGTEEAGRKERYAFFNEILEKTKATKIATAHTANDNAETVFMHILRGSGLSGLKGIAIQKNAIIRPLLTCAREEIEDYCKENNLKPRIDKTNSQNIYTRNKVRNELIPYVQKQFNPNIIVTFNRLADICSQEDAYIENQTKTAYNKVMIEEQKNQIILDLKQFNLQETVIKSRLVLYTINRLFGTRSGIEKKHIEDILILCDRNVGNKYLIPNKKVKVLVKNKKIFFIVN